MTATQILELYANYRILELSASHVSDSESVTNADDKGYSFNCVYRELQNELSAIKETIIDNIEPAHFKYRTELDHDNIEEIVGRAVLEKKYREINLSPYEIDDEDREMLSDIR